MKTSAIDKNSIVILVCSALSNDEKALCHSHLQTLWIDAKSYVSRTGFGTSKREDLAGTKPNLHFIGFEDEGFNISWLAGRGSLPEAFKDAALVLVVDKRPETNFGQRLVDTIVGRRGIPVMHQKRDVPAMALCAHDVAPGKEPVLEACFTDAASEEAIKKAIAYRVTPSSPFLLRSSANGFMNGCLRGGPSRG